MIESQDIRYRKIVELLDIKPTETILEVGARSPACLSRYINPEIDFLGLNLSAPYPEDRIIKLNFLQNQFQERQFTHVVSTDTLEHISENQRAKFVKELIRVADKKVILGVPNPELKKYEEVLITILENTMGGREFISDFTSHDRFDIPEREDVAGYIGDYSFVTIEHLSLNYWITMVVGEIIGFRIKVDKNPELLKRPYIRTFYIISKD